MRLHEAYELLDYASEKEVIDTINELSHNRWYSETYRKIMPGAISSLNNCYLGEDFYNTLVDHLQNR